MGDVWMVGPGPANAITDVAGVRVGHHTLDEGDDVRTGVTMVLPHSDDPYRWRVPAGLAVGNGYGKLMGATQVSELGELETPIGLTNTLCVTRVADALIDWTLARRGNARVQSVNAFVGETNDGRLNDIRARRVRPEHALAALEGASEGPVEQGSVGAGRGTMAFGHKGGIGTASRRLPEHLGGHTVGALVQSNFGGDLRIAGRAVGLAASRAELLAPPRGVTEADGERGHPLPGGAADGSVMIVVATDAPMSASSLGRLAWRGMAGLARTGAAFSNGSGDYAVAFSTAEEVRRRGGEGPRRPYLECGNEALSPLFLATIEAVEEAIYDSLCLATTVTGFGGAVGEALPLEQVRSAR